VRRARQVPELAPAFLARVLQPLSKKNRFARLYSKTSCSGSPPKAAKNRKRTRTHFSVAQIKVLVGLHFSKSNSPFAPRLFTSLQDRQRILRLIPQFGFCPLPSKFNGSLENGSNRQYASQFVRSYCGQPH